jgi:hypothetical protein
MSTATAKKANNQLSDGRVIRALEGTFTQAQMFGLKGRIPSHESIMNVRELDDALNVSGAWKAIDVNGWWRTGKYGFYPKGFEKKDMPIGEKIVYAEQGVTYTLDVPDVPVKIANGETVGLRQAVGMGVVRLEKLKLDQTGEKMFSVSMTTDFDPVNDLKVKEVMRPRGWALVDADGYLLRSKPSGKNVPDARYSYVLHADEFEDGSSGYHGSLARGVDDFDGRRVVYADVGWSEASGMAIISRVAAAPEVEVIKGEGGLIVRGTPEQLEAAARLLEQLKK